MESVGHIPVLVDELSTLLAVRPGEVFVDATVGLGGHSIMILDRLGAAGRLLGLDQDSRTLEQAAHRLAPYHGRFTLYHERFSRIQAVLEKAGVSRVDGILADLGTSSVQLDDAQRGFSFLKDGPLDMRMNPDQKLTAEDLVNRLPEDELSDLIYHNSQERFSRRIAKRICRARREGRIRTTGELVRIVCDALGIDDPMARRGKTHPAMRTFQALRIAVNNELDELKHLLAQAPHCLRAGGRFAVISFHSLEDRTVKRDFLAGKRDRVYEILTKKPMTPSREEHVRNPRCRSAKLRVARRTPTADAP